MRIFFLCLFLLAIFSPAASPQAEESPPVSAQTLAPSGKKRLPPAPPSESEYRTMAALNASCRASAHALYYNCDCVAMRHMDLTRATIARLIQKNYQGQTLVDELARQATTLTERAYYGCVNIPDLAVHQYSRCLDWAVLTRDDYKPFCSCYAVRYAEIFGANVASWMTDTADMRTSAIMECNALSRTTPGTPPPEHPDRPR